MLVVAQAVGCQIVLMAAAAAMLVSRDGGVEHLAWGAQELRVCVVPTRWRLSKLNKKC